MPKKSRVRGGEASVVSGTRQLGRAVNRSHVAVAEWLKHPEWSFGRGPWSATQISAIRQWAARTLAPDPSVPDDQPAKPKRPDDYSPNDRLRIARWQRELFRLTQDQAKIHRVDECELRRTRQIHALKSRLFGEVEGLPLSPEQIELVRNWLVSIVTDYHNGKF